MNEIIWNRGEEKPEPVVVMRHFGQNINTINVLVERDGEGGYRWVSLTMPPAVWDYGSIVDKLVTLYYPNDVMQAVINNYLLDPNDPEASAEFEKMQQWRAASKDYAKQLLAYAEKNRV